MSLPRYQAYKVGGIPWVSEIPSTWRVVPLIGVACERKESNVGMLEDNLLSLSYGRIVRKDIESSDGLLPESFETYQVVWPGDIVLRLTDLQNDKRSLRSARVAERGIITSAYVALRPRAIDGRFLAHLLRAYDLTKVFYSMGGGLRQSMKFDDLKRMPIICPDSAEQTTIAAFLDHETAKIDALIAEQEKLIALLAEKRQATISRAVTRGLDPDVPMKDSPLEWLGRIPAHWSIRRLKHVSPCITVGIVVNPSDYISEDGLPFIYGGDIGEGHIDVDRCRRISPSDSARQPKTQLQTGDLLTVRVGAPGVTAVVPEACEGGNCASVMLIRGGNFDSDWLCYAMNSRVVRYQVEVVQYGAAQEQFNISHAVDFSVPTPPLHEQSKISRLLNGEISRIDRLVFAAREAIALLKERRSALITAAVTGQIDVRQTSAGVSS